MKVNIVFSKEAIEKALELQRDYKRYKDLPLRIYIEGKGCDGFTYGVAFDDSRESDISFDQNGLECIIDPESYLFCQGAKINWVDDERGTGFLVENPNQKKYRGKFYKKKIWQDILLKNNTKTSEIEQ